MNPTRSERKARRSSILKPPKPRQPLQNVDLVASSSENSPATTTTKIKRRVSFAEKKHVKEFCDSMEQGTVWDNTYEESESSNIKITNNDENIIDNAGVDSELMTREKSTISVVTESAVTITQSVNAENTKIFADTFYSSVERDVHVKTSGIPFPANHSGSFNARRSLSVTENVFRRSTNREKSILAESGGPAKTSAAVVLQNPANFVPPPMPDDDCNEVSMDETLIENVLAEPTAPTPLTLSKGEPLLRSSFNMIPNIDFSKNDPITNRRVSIKSKESLIAEDKENLPIDPMELSERPKTHAKNSETIRVYHETSIEMTEAVSSRMSTSKQEKLGEKEPIEKALIVAEGKTTFQMKTVETVTKIMGLSTTSSKELNRSEIDLRPDRMPILLRNKSLNSGELVQEASNTQQIQQPLPERTTIFHDEPADFTEAVQKIPSSEETQERKSERTMVFHDTSLEFTEAIRNVPNTDKLDKLAPERTTIFHDESVNRTESHNVSTVGKPQRALQERTTIVHDKSLDFTNVVQSDSDKENSRKPSPEKTSIFYNQPVEMTEVVRSRSIYEKLPEEKTTIFHNQPLDMTEVVRSRSSCEKLPDERTTIFHNQPLEMTEVVRSRTSCEKQPGEKTTIFHNQPVDMTEVVRSRTSREKIPDEKTTIFHNQPLEMTEVVRSCTSREKLPDEKTTIFHNQPLEMTEVVRSRISCEKEPEEKTTIFHNQPVDMTEVVRSRSNFEKPPLEKTTIFENVSVDMTEAVRTHPTFEKLPPEKTTIFDNISVDMTEAVGGRSSDGKPPAEKTTIFHDQPVDMTEVVRGRSSCEKFPPEKTTIFHNQPVDMTEVVRSGASYEKSPPEKQKVFHNQSVVRTDVDITKPAIDKSLISMPEKATTLQDKSMVMSEMMLSDVNIENLTKQAFEPEIPPEDQTPESSESATRVPIVSAFLSRDSCTPIVERITQQEPLGAEEANRLFATIEMKIPDPEVRSPAAKRMKSLGSRKSIDFTAAIPFIAYRKLARKKCDKINTEDREQHSEEVNFETSSNPEVLGNKLMSMSEAAVDPSTADPLKTLPARSAEIIPQEAQDKTTNLQDISMQMTEAISRPNSYEPPLQKCINSQGVTMCHDDSMEITRAIPGILKATSTIFHDQSMELTRPVLHRPTVESLPVANENSAGEVNRRFVTLPNSEGEALFQDDAMELTRGVQFPSQATEGNRIRLQEAVNPWSKNAAQLEQDGKTMVYCDDSMEITKAVPFPLQNLNESQYKENDPLGIKDPRSFRRSEGEARIGISKNELLEIMESVPFLSSQKNKENRVDLTEMEELRRDTQSEEITGVVPFATHIENENGDSPDTERVASAMGFGDDKMEMTEGIRPCSNIKREESECVREDRHPRLSEMQTFSPMEMIQTRHSHVAKELFQKPAARGKPKAANEGAAVGSETADLQAEIRKLAETFALSNSVDESGFDQATFLQQQARCMEDYEANSTASQDYHTAPTPARENPSYAEKRDSPDPERAGIPGDPAGTRDPTLPTANWAVSSDSNANRSPRNSYSGMDRVQYDKSLEELRCRAYSVSKFRPEVTGFELTAGISMADLGKHYESIFEEKPPSFVFSDTIPDGSIDTSVAAAPVIDGVASVNELPIEPRFFIDNAKTQSPMSVETSYVSVPEVTETVNLLREDKPETEATGVPEVTITPEEDVDKNASPAKNAEVVEQPQIIRHRSQTFVIKRPNSNPTLVVSSPLEEDKETRNERLSGLTTAAEFSSQTADGPSEKIRRRESGLLAEETLIPTVGKEENATELIGIGSSWGNKEFVNSTAIGDDITRQFVRRDVEDTSIMLTYPLSEELPSHIVEIDGQTSDLRPGAKKTDDTMEISGPKSPFDVLKRTVEKLAKRAETIWKINRLDEKIVAFNFFSESIVLAIYLNDDLNSTSPIKVIGFLSQLVEEGTDPGTCLAHHLIMKKVNSASLTHSYQTLEDVSRLLDHVTAEVKLGMDFMFELERLRNRTVMDIQGNRITFMARTRDINAGIILKITMKIKPFEDISSNDITVAYLLGGEKVREDDIKGLITNVKRDHRFLRFYINDVRDYIDLMGETGFSS